MPPSITLKFPPPRSNAASISSSRFAERIAFARLARIEELKALAQQEAALANMSPMERLRDELDMTAEEIAENLEAIQARGLKTLEDGLVDAIMEAESLGDVFHHVANQIIADLIRIASDAYPP